jgi:hypothetical protein
LPGEEPVRHAGAVFRQLGERYAPLKKQFKAVDALNDHPTFDQACGTLKATLTAILEAPPLWRDDAPDVGEESPDGPTEPRA